MNTISRTITGIVMIVVGLLLLFIPLFFGAKVIFSLIYGIPVFIIGLFILFNKKEDEIEKIKRRKIEKK